MGTYTNTKDVLGEQATLDALVEGELSEFVDTDVTIVDNNAFNSDMQIENITLPNLIEIRRNAFSGCKNLKTLRIGLEKESVCTLNSYSGLNNTGHCIFLVPQNLVSSYRVAANWTVVASQIYGDGDTSAPIWDESEISDSDSDLFSRINNGTAANYYKLGQYKSIDLGSFGTVRMQIIAINADELSDGTGTAQLTWLMTGTLPSGYYKRMNPPLSGYTEGTGAIGGWDKSEMKAFLYNDVWAAIPSEWKSVIKEVKKYSKSYDTSGQIQNDVLTNEKIWLISAKEINLSYGETVGPAYSAAFTLDNYTRRRTGSSYWLRTASSTSHFVTIGGTGGSNSTVASSSSYVCFGFCT